MSVGSPRPNTDCCALDNEYYILANTKNEQIMKNSGQIRRSFTNLTLLYYTNKWLTCSPYLGSKERDSKDSSRAILCSKSNGLMCIMGCWIIDLYFFEVKTSTLPLLIAPAIKLWCHPMTAAVRLLREKFPGHVISFLVTSIWHEIMQFESLRIFSLGLC